MRLDDTALARLFTQARTFNAWQPRDVPDSLLEELVTLTNLGPTSANCLPMRLVFVKSKEGKERLRPFLGTANVDKAMTAPVTAIVANDMAFHEHLPRLFPHANAKSWFAGNPELIAQTAMRNGTLQGGYLIMAARALGLDTGALSGYDAERLDADFFANTSWKSNFLLNIGYGDATQLMFARLPRLAFAEIAAIV